MKPTYIKLADLGIKGNSHVMMQEKNNKEIAAVIAKWLDKALKEYVEAIKLMGFIPVAAQHPLRDGADPDHVDWMLLTSADSTRQRFGMRPRPGKCG